MCGFNSRYLCITLGDNKLRKLAIKTNYRPLHSPTYHKPTTFDNFFIKNKSKRKLSKLKAQSKVTTTPPNRLNNNHPNIWFYKKSAYVKWAIRNRWSSFKTYTKNKSVTTVYSGKVLESDYFNTTLVSKTYLKIQHPKKIINSVPSYLLVNWLFLMMTGSTKYLNDTQKLPLTQPYNLTSPNLYNQLVLDKFFSIGPNVLRTAPRQSVIPQVSAEVFSKNFGLVGIISGGVRATKHRKNLAETIPLVLSKALLAQAVTSRVQNLSRNNLYSRYSNVYLNNSSYQKFNNVRTCYSNRITNETNLLLPLPHKLLVNSPPQNYVTHVTTHQSTQYTNFLHKKLYENLYRVYSYQIISKKTYQYLRVYSGAWYHKPIYFTKTVKKRRNIKITKLITKLYSKLSTTYHQQIFNKRGGYVKNWSDTTYGGTPKYNPVFNPLTKSLTSKNRKLPKYELSTIITPPLLGGISKVIKVLNPKIFYLSNKFLFFKKSYFYKKINSLQNLLNFGGISNYYLTNSGSFKGLLNSKHKTHPTFYNYNSGTTGVESSTLRQYRQHTINPSPLTTKFLSMADNTIHANFYTYWFILLRPTLIPLLYYKNLSNRVNPPKTLNILTKFYKKLPLLTSTNPNNNLWPSKHFNYEVLKSVYTSTSRDKITTNLIPVYYHTLIRFMENLSGNLILLQFYPFINQSITTNFIVKYKLWLPRLTFYEKRLGHKFFLEESIHILHIGFYLKDPSLILKWLKAIILRISFWRTRSIFRFIKYLMINFFFKIFPELGIKGFKIRLKGKISAAGNSRKRLILYRIGQTSHSSLNLKVLNEVDTVITFTGVMGLTVSVFY